MCDVTCREPGARRRRDQPHAHRPRSGVPAFEITVSDGTGSASRCSPAGATSAASSTAGRSCSRAWPTTSTASPSCSTRPTRCCRTPTSDRHGTATHAAQLRRRRASAHRRFAVVGDQHDHLVADAQHGVAARARSGGPRAARPRPWRRAGSRARRSPCRRPASRRQGDLGEPGLAALERQQPHERADGHRLLHQPGDQVRRADRRRRRPTISLNIHSFFGLLTRATTRGTANSCLASSETTRLSSSSPVTAATTSACASPALFSDADVAAVAAIHVHADSDRAAARPRSTTSGRCRRS